MDPLSQVIGLLRPHAIFSKPVTGKGRWGVAYSAYELPSFAIVMKGQCWFAAEDSQPFLLERGDFLLLPTTPAFELLSDPGASCAPGHPSMTGVHHGQAEGAPDFEMLGGTFRIEPTSATLLLQMLPEHVHVRSIEGDTGRLARIVALIMEEYSGNRPGREMLLERLLEVMLIEALRWSSLASDAMPAGLLTGLQVPSIAAALRALHADISHGWSVGELARHAGMSRSAFAARFSETVGCTPMDYLSRWRMSLAQDTLTRSEASLERLAQDIGYGSASAFSTAFRKWTGHSPGAFAREHRRAQS